MKRAGPPLRTLALQAALALSFLLCTPSAYPSEGWRHALAPRSWEFPRDHGAHPQYRTEWWYLTGNLVDEKGNRYGYELTFFRQGIRAKPGDPSDPWSLRDLYLAHFTVTDVEKKRFLTYERVSRRGPGLAGSRTDRLDVRLLGWSARMEGERVRLRAASDRTAVDLTLTFEKPPVLNGEKGLSRKGALPGQASYYASCTCLKTDGSIGAAGAKSIRVRGTSWFDHEFGSNRLGADQAGWDWFGLHLSDGRDLMLYLLRRKDGALEPVSSGTIVDRGGKSRHIPLSAIKVEVLDHWRSPKSGAVYPSRWRLRLPGEAVDLSLSPLLHDQELVTGSSTGVTYWEGAAEGRGTSKGREVACLGYVELTGYAGGLGGLSQSYQ